MRFMSRIPCHLVSAGELVEVLWSCAVDVEALWVTAALGDDWLACAAGGVLLPYHNLGTSKSSLYLQVICSAIHAPGK